LKKLLFGITSLTIGGAERVLVDLCNRLIEEDYDITIFSIYGGGVLEKELDPRINVINLYEKSFKEYNKIQILMKSLRLLFFYKIKGNYDVAISFLEGPIVRLFSKIKGIKKISWIHVDISKIYGTGIKSKIKQIVDKNFYSKYDNLVFVSEENKKDFEGIYGKQKNSLVIRNYLDYNKIIFKSNLEEELPYDNKTINLVMVSRLTFQKGIDRFIKIYHKLEKSGLHSNVYIVGDGPLRFELQKQIDALGETINFMLLGEKTNPYPYIKNADIFCLLSYFEGYGMVVEEAKILNKKIIITDTAARESFGDYENGMIVPNTEKGIFDGLSKMIKELGMIDEVKSTNSQSFEEYYDDIIRDIKNLFNGEF
jgi:glycosyltransferase